MSLDDAERWKKRKEHIICMYDGRCAYCGCEISVDNFQIDHVVSKFEYQYHLEKYKGFDFHGIKNLKPACCSCNNFKRAHTLEQFRIEIESQIDRLRKYHPPFRLAERYGLIDCAPKKVVFYFETIPPYYGEEV